MESNWSRDGEEYAFAIAMPGFGGHGFTVSHAKSDVTGQLSYLRVLQTAGEAILDFCMPNVHQALLMLLGSTRKRAKTCKRLASTADLLHANAATR
jgi:hypothetical protein